MATPAFMPRPEAGFEPRVMEWAELDVVRDDVETLMGFLNCSAADAVMIFQLNLILRADRPWVTPGEHL